MASAIVAFALQSGLPEASAKPQPAGRQPVPVALSLHEAVALAWQRLPQRPAFAAQQATAAARYGAGGALVPNAPTATGSYVNDKVAGSNYNYLTAQLGVSTPLWLPGEGTATQRLAQADGAAAAAAAEAAHLAVASQVVDLAAQAAAAINARDVATRRLATSRALATDLVRRFQVGESSQSDSLAADAEAASASLTLAGAEGQAAAAQAALAAVTGTGTAVSLNWTGATRSGDGQPPHPRIAAAEQAVTAAQANARLVRIADRDDPEIGLQGINEKQPGARWDTRFGVTAVFHFATEARNAPRRAAAEQAVTEAMVQLAQVQRDVGVASQQADAVLAGAQRGSAAADRAAAALEQRRGQIERAWKVGEMPLIELVRANALAFDAAYARDRAHTDRQAAQVRVALAQGIVP